jgi:iron complex transport system ATP-binding protein
MLEAHNISLHFRQRRVLTDISLAIRPAELVVLAGMNGAGKSTLLKLLSGDMRPDRGHVSLHGRPLDEWPLNDMARIRAVMPQESRLTFPFTALDVVVMGRYAHHCGYPSRADRGLARSMMESLDVGHLTTRLYPTLSGGERARVQLARALCQLKNNARSAPPPTLLLDEPTASLDLGHQQTALAAARDCSRQEGAAVCAVLHDLNLAAQHADRIIILHDGGIAADGNPERVLTESLIQRAFGIRVLVTRHPAMNCPLVVTAPALQ